jgi:polysaccharide chain length determinant protein (PEP-CTERM system associated)
VIHSPRTIILLLIAAAWRRRTLIIVPLLVLPVLGAVASLFVPKSYEARMSILIQEPTTLNPILRDISIESNVKERLPALQALLHSDHILGRVVTDLGLINDKSSHADRDREVKSLSDAITVQLVGTDLLELRLRGQKSGGLGKTLKAISERLVERLVAPARSAVGDSERFLNEQLDERRTELEKAEQALTEFKTANSARLPALYSSSVARMAALNSKLEEKSMELAAADAAFSETRKRLAGTNPVVGRIEEEMVKVSSELANLRARYTGDHSEVVAAERKLQSLQDQRQQLIKAAQSIDTDDLDRLWNMAAGMTQGDRAAPPLLVSQMQSLQEAQAHRASLREDVDQLKRAIEELKKAMAEFAPIEQRQQQLERALAVARESYEALSKRYELTRVTDALGKFTAPERIKVIDEPSDPTSSISLPHFVIVLAALVGALILGIGLSVVAELMDSTIRQSWEYVDIVGAPVLARLPRVLSPPEPQATPRLS